MVDRQNRVGIKFGGGAPASAAAEANARKERQRQLALETIDLDKDPYFCRNNIGKIECKLCITLHNTEGKIIKKIIFYIKNILHKEYITYISI